MALDENEFIMQQKAAMERMNEMQRRSKFPNETHTMPPTPPFVKIQANTQSNSKNEKKETFLRTEAKTEKRPQKTEQRGSNVFRLPFDFFKGDKDITLILGLLLILINEKADRKLLLALLYILL